MCLSAFVSGIQYATFFETLPQLWLQELADRNILSETLSPSRLKDKVSCCRLRARHLKRTELHLSIKRITRNNFPLVEDQAHGRLSLCVNSQVCFEAERIDDGYQGPRSIKWCARDGSVRKNMPSSLQQNSIQRGN